MDDSCLRRCFLFQNNIGWVHRKGAPVFFSFNFFLINTVVLINVKNQSESAFKVLYSGSKEFQIRLTRSL